MSTFGSDRSIDQSNFTRRIRLG